MSARTLFTMALVAAVSGCQQPAPAALSDADKAAITAVTDSAMALANAGAGWEAYTAHYYAEDAIVSPPNEGPLTGRSAILEWYNRLPVAVSNFRVQQLEVNGLGDLAYVRGTYAMDLTAPGAAAAMHDEGKYIEIWRRQADGTWKVIRDIYNTSLPMPAEPPGQ